MPSITHREVHTLQNALAGMESTPRANCIYIIRRDDVPIYVGKTVRGVATRLKQHIKNADDIGITMNVAISSREDWTVEIWHIDHGLVIVEQQTIVQLQPYLNKTGR